MEETSIYLHIPFCKQRCSYCDFNTYAGLESIIPAYVEALCREIVYVAHSAVASIPVHTIYFGGGTPSILPLDRLEKILTTLRAEFHLAAEVEISLEANPGTLSNEYLYGLKNLRINRLSIGMQSALAHELGMLGRIHTYKDVVQSFEWARQAGFSNINLDLIYGLPNQALGDWQLSLRAGMELQPEHFSLYALTLEDETPMAQWIKQGLMVEQDADLAADMYEWAGCELGSSGYESYEISNWASIKMVGKNYTCRHNLQYWRGKPYLGLGAGAHGYADHTRTANVMSPLIYIKKMQAVNEPQTLIFPASPAVSETIHQRPDEERGEFMLMGLRLTQEGVGDEEFRERFGKTLEDFYGYQIERLIKVGLLEWVDSATRLRLTTQGRLLGNQVFREFI